MPGTPFDWNIVIPGAWNLAILTPAGVARRLFGLAVGTPIEVMIPIDGLAPIRIKHDRIEVVPSSRTLIVAPMDLNPEGLRKASVIAAKALASLPETPVNAAGVNLRYRFDTVPDEVLAYSKSSLDDRLGDAGELIKASSMRRDLKWDIGAVNLEMLIHEDSSSTITLNFHLQSMDALALQDWIKMTDKMCASADKVMKSVIGLGE